MKKGPTKKQAAWMKEQMRLTKNLVDAFEAYTNFHKPKPEHPIADPFKVCDTPKQEEPK